MVSISCVPLAFLPSASPPNSGGTLLIGISLPCTLKDSAAAELVGGASTTQPA